MFDDTAFQVCSDFSKTITNKHFHKTSSFVLPSKPKNEMTEISIESGHSSDLALFEDLPCLSNKFDESMVSLVLPTVKRPDKNCDSDPDYSNSSDEHELLISSILSER